MLYYQDIYTTNSARYRLKHNLYNRQWMDNHHSADGDKMLEFTFSAKAQEQSLSNFEFIRKIARQYDLSTLVIAPNRIQLAGPAGSERNNYAAAMLFTRDWLKTYEEWLDTKYPQRATLQDTVEGQEMDFYSYRKCLCLTEHQGVYDVESGERIKNRKAIIERFWSLGFATHRGRPPVIAKLKYTGTRADLQEITDLADRYWNRGRSGESDVAKKIVSAYRSINRYAAWPGAW